MSDKRELSRAEIVRQRRAQQAAKELHQTTQRATKPLKQVTARAVPTRPMVKPARVDNPRRFNIALGLPEFKQKFSDGTCQAQLATYQLPPKVALSQAVKVVVFDVRLRQGSF